ncbi:hypothetical protein [Achromobacter kerstersii]|uniref:hypothetical protein n=1 Tax=Achromobacter kerstersii TaxID=1353890 RepID=UPI00158372CA|nr:hypothetical protein [Achromobacter kerstersii]
MNLRLRRTCITLAASVALSMTLLQGCAADSRKEQKFVAMEQDKSFVAWRDRLISDIKADPTYKRVPLDSEAQTDEFLLWLYDAYHHRVSKQEFSSWMNGQYPGHQHEVAFITAKIP